MLLVGEHRRALQQRLSLRDPYTTDDVSLELQRSTIAQRKVLSRPLVCSKPHKFRLSLGEDDRQ